jgi:hypothetical protein
MTVRLSALLVGHPIPPERILIFFWLALQPLWALVSFQFPDLFTGGRTPWTSDQLLARPLPKHKTTQKKTHIHTPNIHTLSGIRTNDHSIRASEDSSCLWPLGYHDRRMIPGIHYNLFYWGGCTYVRLRDFASIIKNIHFRVHEKTWINYSDSRDILW